MDSRGGSERLAGKHKSALLLLVLADSGLHPLDPSTVFVSVVTSRLVSFLLFSVTRDKEIDEN